MHFLNDNVRTTTQQIAKPKSTNHLLQTDQNRYVTF